MRFTEYLLSDIAVMGPSTRYAVALILRFYYVFIYFHICACVHTCVHITFTHGSVYMELRGQVYVLSFHRVGPRDCSLVVGLGLKSLYLMSHLTALCKAIKIRKD